MMIPEKIEAASPVVEVQGLTKAYGEVEALRGIDFSIPSGEVVGFLGPNGAGKTTAIKILTGFLAADSGSVHICGLDVETHPLEVKAKVGYLPENNPLYLDMRVGDYLAFAWKARGGEGAASEALDRAVVQTGLQQVFHRFLGECSKGFRQRTGIAQSLLHDPELLLLDEPTNGLDPLQVVEIRNLILELGRTKTVLLTTHVLSEVEALAEKVVLIHEGRKVADGSLDSIAGGESSLQVHLGIRGTEKDLRGLVEQAGGTWVSSRPRPFGDEDCCACSAEVSGPAGIEALASQAAAMKLALVELAPQGGGLEALFRKLAGGGPA